MKRRTRRLELGERKRKRDEDVCKMRRRTDENAVWSWWKVRLVDAHAGVLLTAAAQHERDELQVDIGAEINRKRRRVDREYKQQTRPLPRAHTRFSRLLRPFIEACSTLQYAAFPHRRWPCICSRSRWTTSSSRSTREIHSRPTANTNGVYILHCRC